MPALHGFLFLMSLMVGILLLIVHTCFACAYWRSVPIFNPETASHYALTSQQLKTCSSEHTEAQYSINRPFSLESISSPDDRLPSHDSSAIQGSIRYVLPYGGRKIVALTFDLCEGANETSGYDRPLIEYLRKDQIKATFFAGGKWMESHPEETMQLMAVPYFEIGNHTWSHINCRTSKIPEIRDQILRTQAIYEVFWERMKARRSADSVDTVETHNVRPRLRIFRFPYGACNPEALQILADLGVPAIQWSIVSGDPDIHQTTNGITRTVLKQLRPGSIVIFHANGRGHGTSQALPVLVNRLRQLGYETVTVSELLGSGEIYSTSECYEMKPGDNLIYDKRTKHKQKRNR